MYEENIELLENMSKKLNETVDAMNETIDKITIMPGFVRESMKLLWTIEVLFVEFAIKQTRLNRELRTRLDVIDGKLPTLVRDSYVHEEALHHLWDRFHDFKKSVEGDTDEPHTDEK